MKEFCEATNEECIKSLLLVGVAETSTGELDVDCGEDSDVIDAVLGGKESVPLSYAAAKELYMPQNIKSCMRDRNEMMKRSGYSRHW